MPGLPSQHNLTFGIVLAVFNGATLNQDFNL
jgi:hypothetical protein